jgi:hypothetical protein
MIDDKNDDEGTMWLPKPIQGINVPPSDVRKRKV